MAEFKLGRIRFIWKNNWTTGITYVKDDIVRNGGKTYLCVVGHIAAADFYTDLDHSPTRWNQVSDGSEWKGDWTTNFYYKVNDLVKFGGIVYLCNEAHTSNALASSGTSPELTAGLEVDQTKWDIYATSFDWKSNWAVNTRYKKNDIVRYGATSYVCNTGHTSSATDNTDIDGLEQDQSSWDIYAKGFDWIGDWTPSYRYKRNDVVLYGGVTYVCNTGHLSASTLALGLENDQGLWDSFHKGIKYLGYWSSGASVTGYINDGAGSTGTTLTVSAVGSGHLSVGQILTGPGVTSGTTITELLTGTFPGTTGTYQVNFSQLVGTSSAQITITGAAIRYRKNDVVKYGSDLWICITNHTSSSVFAETNWALFVGGLEFENSWSSSGVYQPGDVVSYGGYAYVSKTNNTNKTPTSNITDWDLFTTGFSFQGDWAVGQSYKVGQVLRLNGYTYVAILDHTSSTSNVMPNLTYWARLNSGIKWNANTQTFNTISGTNIVSSGTSATFNITASGTYYQSAINNPGTGYAVNDTIKVLGSAVGGITPANDLIITVNSITGGGGTGPIATVTTTGFSVTWMTTTVYSLGDTVYFGVNSYICVLGHTASSLNRPDIDSTGVYWNLLSVGAISSTLSAQGDTLYYGAGGPTRLPIGTDGQVLRVTGNSPTWAYFGVINNVVYVSGSGADAVGNGQGLTLDKPFKTVRFAAKQVEDGYLNPSAALMITKNKQFLIKEVNNYILYTFNVTVTGTSSGAFTTTNTSGINVNMPIVFAGTVGGVTSGQTYYVKAIVANTSFTISATQTGGIAGVAVSLTGSGTMTGAYSYIQSKAERDAGIIVDAIAYDISHGGNGNTTAATQAFYSGGTYISGVLSGEISVFVASHAVLNTLITNVLANTAPAVNYQALNGVLLANQAIQNFDPSLTAELGTSTTASSLITLVDNGLSAASSTAIPAAVFPNTTISVKTGTFSEVLPIVVPKNTAIVGDELRGTVVQPLTANANLVNDKAKTISVLTRVKAIIPNLLANTAVTPTSGNTQPQVYMGWSGTTATTSVTTNTGIMSTIINGGLGSVPSFIITDPTGGTNNAYTAGFFNARRLIVSNKSFIQNEIQAYMVANYYSLWTSLLSAGQSNCLRDIGYIVDALQYDLSYGGNLETQVAARSYYSLGTFVENSNEKTAALAVQAYLKTFIDNIALGTTGWGQLSGGTQDTSGTPGSNTAAIFAQTRIQEIYDCINTSTTPTTVLPDQSWVSTGLQGAAAAIQARKAFIQASATQYVSTTYPALNYVVATCYRDVGYIVDALTYDLMFGSNFQSVKAAMAYYRATASAQNVIANQKTATLSMMTFINSMITRITNGVTGDTGSTAAISSVLTSAATMTTILQNGITTVPAFTFTNPTGYNVGYLGGYGDGKTQIVQNYQYIKTYISQYLFNNYLSVYNAINVASCQRDIGYLLDALQYDMTYGGNTQTLIAGSAYFSNNALTIASTEKTATLAAYATLKTMISNIVLKTAPTVNSPNTTFSTTGYISGTTLTISSAVTGTIMVGHVLTMSGITAGTYITGYIAGGSGSGSTWTVSVSQTVASSGSPIAVSGANPTQVTAGTAGSVSAATFAQARIQDVIDWITNGTTPTAIAPTASLALASTAQQTAYNALQSAKTEIQGDTLSWVNKFYQALNFNTATCSRDTGYIVDALAYDYAFGTNFNSIKVGMAYYRATTSAQYVLSNQLTAEIGSINFIAQKAKRIAAAGSVAQITTTIDDVILKIAGSVSTTATATATGGNITVTNTAGMLAGMPITFSLALGGIIANQPYWIISVIDNATITVTSTFGSSTPITLSTATGTANVTAGGGVETTGTNAYNNTATTIEGAELLRANKNFLSYEATAWVNANYGGTATSITSNVITTSLAHNLTVGDPVVFSGTTFGNIIAGTVYYVLSTPLTTTFTITAVQSSPTPFALTNSTGSMTVAYSFSASLCRRDIASYVDSLVYDVLYLGNYKSLRSAILYNNAVNGSLLSDMFYMRNGTGLRNMTTSGLTGGLSSTNAYGTKRPLAGAYTSLDPGYGPTDSNVWITLRSPYIQNVTTFGTGCVGCKIDGALHAGGNRSIVSNDFTQVLSDGIGVWCTGSQSLTELVSVFSYYNYAGYLAEYGGKIRATNGNNSYGTYGSLAEGVDTFETAVTATVNNRYNPATITNVVTDSTNQIYRYEFANAGSNYNTVTYSIGGTGYNAAVVGNEFRDNAVFQTRILTGGASYVTQANTAQGGSLGNISLAATDSAISAAYVGMRIQVTGGSGVGNVGAVLDYNSGTKLAKVFKESFAPLTVTGTTITNNLLTVASTAGLLYAGMPIYVDTTVAGLTAYTLYYVNSANFSSTQFQVSTTAGGAGVAVTITATLTGQTIKLYAAGWDHIVPGTTVTNALDLTSAYIVEPRLTFTSPAFTPTAGTQTSAAWADCVYGDTNVTYSSVVSTGGSGLSATYNIVRTGVAYAVTQSVSGSNYKAGDTLTIAGTLVGGTSPTNDITISVTAVSSGSITNFTYTGTGAGGLYLAIPTSGTTTMYSTNGTSFSAAGGTVALASASWTSLAYGNGRWVAVSNGTASSYTTDALTFNPGVISSANWTAVCYGNGVFMAVASGGTAAAYSSTGATWIATGALPASTTWSGVAYGAGVYVAVATGGTQAAVSTDGATWTSKTLPASANWSSVTFGRGLFVAVASGSTSVAYSKDGLTWLLSGFGMPVSQLWSKVRYGQGLFFATATGSTTTAATSEDGILWTSRTLTGSAAAWPAIAFGNPSSVPKWVALTTSTTAFNTIVTGATAKARVKITVGAFSEIRMTEPGSGYTSAPTVTVVDSNITAAATWSVRLGVGALANPTFSNRGLQYATATATVQAGNGYADEYQTGYYINLANLPSNPTAGSNVVFTGNNTYYKLVQVTNFLGTGVGAIAPYTGRLQVSPAFTVATAPAHGTAVTIRIKYSQVRLTGHDFLSIGTGNVATTNYPGIPLQAFDVNKQTVAYGGGRVFYTSTDQDGNFNVGTLFSVQQATGVASINADAFNLAGLNSLTLGSVALGGTGATITQFSTDPYFTANSDNIVPTQKAIKSYVSSQIGGGSSSLNVNTLTAGVIYLSGNTISTTTGVQINVTATMNFTGGINGMPIAMNLLLLG